SFLFAADDIVVVVAVADDDDDDKFAACVRSNKRFVRNL
ncbi:unnamed protein product, partial [Rotaria magnacalcarata]